MLLIGVTGNTALGKIQHPGSNGRSVNGEGQSADHRRKAVKLLMDAPDVSLQFTRGAIERLDMAGLAGPATDFGLIDDSVLLTHPVVE